MKPESVETLSGIRRTAAYLRGLPSLSERYGLFSLQVPLAHHGRRPFATHREELGPGEYRRLLLVARGFLAEAVRAGHVLPAIPRVPTSAVRLLQSGLALSRLQLSDESISGMPLTQSAIFYARIAEGVNARLLGRAMRTFLRLQPRLVG